MYYSDKTFGWTMFQPYRGQTLLAGNEFLTAFTIEGTMVKFTFNEQLLARQARSIFNQCSFFLCD